MVLLYALVISVGIGLGRLKIAGVSQKSAEPFS